MHKRSIILYWALLVISVFKAEETHAKEISGKVKTPASTSALRKKIEGEILFLAPVAMTEYKALEKESDLKQEHINRLVWSLQAQAPTVMGCIKEALNTEPPADYRERKKGDAGRKNLKLHRYGDKDYAVRNLHGR